MVPKSTPRYIPVEDLVIIECAYEKRAFSGKNRNKNFRKKQVNIASVNISIDKLRMTFFTVSLNHESRETHTSEVQQEQIKSRLKKKTLNLVSESDESHEKERNGMLKGGAEQRQHEKEQHTLD